MSELDVVMRASLGRLAEPGDPTGVADAVRARVGAAGAGGEAPPGSGPAGGGGSDAASGASGASGFWSGWGLFAVLGVAGLVGGAGLAIATQDEPPVASSPPVVALPADQWVPGAACPGGAAVTQLEPGALVLALAVSDGGGFFEVRDPGALGRTVWIAASSGEPQNSADVAALPVSGCDEGGEIVAEPSPEPLPTDEPAPEPTDEPAPGPGPAPGPAPAPDTQNPGINVGGWSESYINTTVSCATPPQSAQISVSATDNLGVTSVTASASNGQVSVSGPSVSGSTYTFTVTYSGNTDSSTKVTFVAKDAANNQSSVTSSTLQTLACFG